MHQSLFSIGDIIRHRRLGYRGVIIDVDAVYSLPDEWYESVATSRPPKDKPWYHVLVHEMGQETYVAERHLEHHPDPGPVEHPEIDTHLTRRNDGGYSRKGAAS
jgi:heat shock protein HspQ